GVQRCCRQGCRQLQAGSLCSTSRCSARRKFLAVFCVARFPAQRGNSISQFVASFPIFCVPCVLALLCKLRHFYRDRDFGFRFEIEDRVDPFPPIQPCVCRGGVEFVFIHRAVRLPNRFEQESERRGNV